MAPELALAGLKDLPASAVVLDPMVGSGTVVRQAVSLGQSAIGFDLDPLAVLISRVSTIEVDDSAISKSADRLISAARALDNDAINLPWIDGDVEAEAFIEYWFGVAQRKDLRRLAFLLIAPESLAIPESVADVLRIAFSRIIVTKHQCASLAQDTSHSRPHKVTETSTYDVFKGFAQSVIMVRRRLASILGRSGRARILLGDARSLSAVADNSIDAVLTSPPYLNAIDYLRGHRLSLVWLGHRLRDLSAARSASIGSERKPDVPLVDTLLDVRAAVGDIRLLPSRFQGIVDRYVIDIHQMVSEVFRTLKNGGKATFVVGDSCLRGVYIRNSEALAAAAEKVGLSETQRIERDLPIQHRYLPTPKGGALGKRMRQEIVLSFAKT
jgi:hypothetical protein